VLTYKSHNHTIERELVVVCEEQDSAMAYDVGGEDTPELIGSCSLVSTDAPVWFLLDETERNNLHRNDVLTLHPNGRARKVFDVNSNDNTLFTTGQCNNLCLMCSQPPVKTDDVDYYSCLNKFIIDHLPETTENLGISGGEPTLLGSRLIDLIQSIFNKNPDIALHLLSNGRYFASKAYASGFGEFAGSDLMIGIPLHSDHVHDHNYIAGAAQAFNQTMSGIYNLARYGLDIEIRIVVNRLNYQRLPQLSNYIFRNLPFVRHVAFMGMEYTGLSIKNHRQIWIDPMEYQDQLEEAVMNLALWGMNVSVYNTPHCLLKPSLHEFSRQSISDWKESYSDECQKCAAREECCGLFATAKIHSPNIKAIRE